MNKKTIRMTVIIIITFFLLGLAIGGFLYHHRNRNSRLPYQVNVGLRTKVTWNVSDDIPVALPVYSTEKAEDLSYVWGNILAYCGLSNDRIEFSSGTFISTDEWNINVDDNGEIYCWKKHRNSSADNMDQMTYTQLEELANVFLEELGINTKPYYISGYPVDPEGIHKTLDYSYTLGEYKADNFSKVISISFVGSQIADFSIHYEDISECGKVSTVSLSEIKSKIKEVVFYTNNPDLSKMISIDNLTISNIDIIYERENNMLVPYYDIEGAVMYRSEEISVTARLAAYKGPITSTSASGNSDTIKMTEDEAIVAPIKSFYNTAMTYFRERDFHSAMNAFSEVIKEATLLNVQNPVLELLKNKAILYQNISDIQLGDAHFSSNLEKCKEYFDSLSAEDTTYITAQELSTLQVYSNLALAHICTAHGDYSRSSEYLKAANEIMITFDHNTIVDVFYYYEKTNLSPYDVDELYDIIYEWRDSEPASARNGYSYYSSLLKIMAARAYIQTDPERAYDIIKHDLMYKSVYYGETDEEVIRVLAEIYTVYGDYLEEQDAVGNYHEILSCRQAAATLFENLMMMHFDGVIIDGVYYVQTAQAYYNLALLYTKIGQTDFAIRSLEYLFGILKDCYLLPDEQLYDIVSLGKALHISVEDSGNFAKWVNCLEMIGYEPAAPINEYYNANLNSLIGRDDADENNSPKYKEDILAVRTRNKRYESYPEINISQIVLKDNGAENTSLMQAVEQINCEISKITQGLQDDLLLDYRSCLANGYNKNHYLNTEICITRCDDKVLSVLLRIDYNTNGPHEMTEFHAFNYSFDKQVLLTEQVLVDDLLYNEVYLSAKEKYRDIIYADRIDSSNSEVVLTTDGYAFIFAPGSIASYSNGIMDVTILYDNLEPWIPAT